MFECHITLLLKDKEIGERVAKELHWTTSEIERDPVLGKASYFYLTTHGNVWGDLFTKMKKTVDACNYLGATVVREKIEAILHDVRYDRGQNSSSANRQV